MSPNEAKKLSISKIDFQRWLDAMPYDKPKINSYGYGQYLKRKNPKLFIKLYEKWKTKKIEEMRLQHG